MASTPATSTSSLARYRPAVLVLTGLSAALGIYFIHQNYLSLSDTSKPPAAPLRRRNAVHRPGTRRRRAGRTNSGSGPDTQPYVEQALARLEVRDRERRNYGSFTIQLESGSVVVCELLPSLLRQPSDLQQLLNIPIEVAIELRARLEVAFLTGFFRAEFPSSYVIERGTREGDLLRNGLLRQGLSEPAIDNTIRLFNEDPEFGTTNRQGAFSLPVDGATETNPTTRPLEAPMRKV